MGRITEVSISNSFEISGREGNLRHRWICQREVLPLPFQPFGTGDTERCIEIPWATSCYRGERRVLDVGYANAEDRYISPLLGQGIPELYGLDLSSRVVPNVIAVAGDMRRMPFRDAVFDLIFCISTIEHVGRDNTIYGQGPQVLDQEGDLQAIKELGNLTKPGGKMVITVPYGKLHNYGWFLHYDKQRFDKLIQFSGCHLLKKDLFLYKNGWHRACETALSGVLYRDNDAPAAAGLACALLERPGYGTEPNNPDSTSLSVARNTTVARKKNSLLFYVSGFHNVENWSGMPTRWMQADATLLVNSLENQISTLSLNALSFYRNRTLEIYSGDELVMQVVVPVNLINISTPIHLANGANAIWLRVLEGCERPCDKPELKNPDGRCLSVAVQNLALT